MEHTFWHQRWQQQQIGFHEPATNPHLIRHLPSLDLPPGARILLPLCGKSLDIVWLLEQGYHVIGIELSEVAVQSFFSEHALAPSIRQNGALTHYQSQGLDLYQGDFFDLQKADVGPVDAIYDRGALVALPESMRSRYTASLNTLSEAAPQLLVTYHYDPSHMAGPPFSIDPLEIEQHYGQSHHILPLCQDSVLEGLKGDVKAKECVWHLTPR